MWTFTRVPVGRSNAPIATPIQSCVAGGSKNSDDPQAPQKPRRTFADDWNQVRFALKGEEVTLSLNGQPIARYLLDDANTRFFGFFRYIDLTQARIRRVTYRGDWSRTVPPVAEQELAARPGESPVSIGGNANEQRFDVSAKPAELKRQGFERVGIPNAFQSQAEGLTLRLTADGKSGKSAALVMRKPLTGDFEVTGRFKDLTLGRPGPNMTTRFGLGIRLGDKDSPDLVAAERSCDANGQQQIRAICHRARPDGETFSGENYDWSNVNRMAAGEFRLVRRGSRVYHLVREAGEKRFTVIESQPVSAEPIIEIELGLYSDDTNATSSVVVQELSIRSK